MRVAGLGFGNGASLGSLRSALEAAGGTNGLALLATLDRKAGARVFLALAHELGTPVVGVAAPALARQATLTCSRRSLHATGTGSLAEAAALAAAGRNARLLGPRCISSDGLATAALAEGDAP